jgi:cytochrome c-type biogenesis protein CcmH/NrfG
MCLEEEAPAASIRSFTRVTELEPDSYVGWMNLGSSLLATKRFKEAVKANEKALSLGPHDAVANSQLGLSQYYLHHPGATPQDQGRQRWKGCKPFLNTVTSDE